MSDTGDGRLATVARPDWRFRLQLIEDGLRVTAGAPGGEAPAVWLVKGVIFA